MSEYSSKLREKLARVSGEMHAINNQAKKQNRGLTSAEREKFNRLEAAYTELEDSAKIAEKCDSLAGRLANSPSGPIRIGDEEFQEARDTFRISAAEVRRRKNARLPHALAFSAYLRHGDAVDKQCRDVLDRANAGVILNTMSTTTGSQGGYVVPIGFSDELEVAMQWFGGINNGVVGEFTTATGDTVQWPTVNDTNNRGRLLGQNQQATETDVVFNQVSFGAYIFSSDVVTIPLSLITDSYFDLDALVAELLGIRLGRAVNYFCTIGTGTNNSQPMGISTAALNTANVYQFPTHETAAISYQDMVELEHAVDIAYRELPTTRWMFHDSMLKLIKKLLDGQNRPLWLPPYYSSFQTGIGATRDKPTVLGHEYYVNNDMPVPAANAYSVIFGDLSKFKVRRVAGGTTVQVLRERYADYMQRGYLGHLRLDSQYVSSGGNALVVGQQSAT